MATIALVCRRINVIRFLSRCGNAIVTGATGTNYITVIQSRRSPGKWIMAIITTIIAGNMPVIFTGSDLPIVTTGTILWSTLEYTS